MKNNRFALIFIALLFLVGSVQAKSALLRLNLKKGTVYEMNMTSNSAIEQEMMGQNMKINQKLEMNFSYLVTDVLPNKNFRIEYALANMKMNMNVNGNEMSFDSQSDDQSNPVNSILKKLADMKIAFEITPTGQVEHFEGIDNFIKQFSGNMQAAQALQMFSNPDNLNSFIGQTFNYLPEKKVKVGDKWTSEFKIPMLMNTATTLNFEVAGISRDVVNLNVASDVNAETPIEQNGMKINMKMNGTQTGTMAINPEDGWLTSSDMTQNFDMKMNMKNPQNNEDMEIPMKINTVIKMITTRK